jgi:hypothetical protein
LAKPPIMKKFVMLVFAFSSIYLSGQTKDEAFDEMNTIVKKAQGKVISTLDAGNDITLVKQSLYPVYEFEVMSQGVSISLNAEKIPWEQYNHGVEQPDEKSGLIIYWFYFDKKFKISMTANGNGDMAKMDHISLYVSKNDITRMEELLQIVSKKE